MADFNPPFGEDADRRFPTVTEAEQGHPCGDADRGLFNGLQYRVEAEIGEVISFAGITMTDDRMTQLREAIQAIVASMLPIIDPEDPPLPPSDFVLMSQARTRLPHYPEVLNPTGLITPTAGTGSIVVPTGVSIMHRGIYPMQTGDVLEVNRTFATAVSTTYHLRANLQGATPVFSLKNTVDGTYNPTSLVESHPNFDSNYDDMLIARVITNSSNVPTVTPLVNKDRHFAELISTVPRGSLSNAGSDGASATGTVTWNFARKPAVMHELSNLDTQSTQQPGYIYDVDTQFTYAPNMPNRYGAQWFFLRDYEIGPVSFRFVPTM